jgi:hypothetical protein
MPALAALLTKGNKMADKIEGYKKRGSLAEMPTPKETKNDISTPSPLEGSSMSTFRKSIEDHMNDINSGRGNGIPDNYQEKKDN